MVNGQLLFLALHADMYKTCYELSSGAVIYELVSVIVNYCHHSFYRRWNLLCYIKQKVDFLSDLTHNNEEKQVSCNEVHNYIATIGNATFEDYKPGMRQLQSGELLLS